MGKRYLVEEVDEDVGWGKVIFLLVIIVVVLSAIGGGATAGM